MTPRMCRGASVGEEKRYVDGVKNVPGLLRLGRDKEFYIFHARGRSWIGEARMVNL